MYLRLYWAKIQPGSWNAIRDRYLEYGNAEVPGRLARWVTQDTNDPESVITVTLWSDKAAIQTWESSDQYRTVTESMRAYFVGSQTVSLCEVLMEHPSGLLQAARRPRDAAGSKLVDPEQ